MARNTIARPAATVAAPVVTAPVVTVDVSKGVVTGITKDMMAGWLDTARQVSYAVITVGSIVTTVVGTQRFTGVVTSSSVNSRNVRTVSVWVINPETGTFAMVAKTLKDGSVVMARVSISGIPTTHCTVNVAAPVAVAKAAKAKTIAPYVSFGR